MIRRFIVVAGALLFATLLMTPSHHLRQTGVARAAGGTLMLGDEVTVATYAQRSHLGFRFGFVDGAMGAVRDEDQFVFFGSAGSNATCKGTPNTQGVYRLVPSPSDPTRGFTSDCSALLTTTPGPTGQGDNGPFDRDYVGGGPVLRVTSEDGSRHGILLVYHAEFQWGSSGQCGSAPCFFGTLGLAFSTDDGVSFQKLGQIIQPYLSRSEWITNNPKRSLAIGDGAIALGDANAEAVDPRNASPADTYIYVYYIDQDDASDCGSSQCLAVARASESDVIAAAFADNTDAVPSLFKKYYQGSFSEPAATGHPNNLTRSGRYSSVLHGGFSPSTLYDEPLGQVIMAYQTGDTISLRTSANLVDWSAPVIATLDDGAEQVRYPSLIGDDEAAVGGSSPLLYYTYIAPGSGATWPRSTFMVRRLNVTP